MGTGGACGSWQRDAAEVPRAGQLGSTDDARSSSSMQRGIEATGAPHAVQSPLTAGVGVPASPPVAASRPAAFGKNQKGWSVSRGG